MSVPENSTVILRATVGSTIHGTALFGQDDRDEMAIAVEPEAYVLGLREWETTVERTQPEGVRSGLGVTLHGGYCSYSLIPIGEAPRVLSENGFDATIDVSALEFVVSARGAEWQKLREFAP